MDASNPDATTPQEYQGGTANWRTDLYATGGTLLSHKESIQLIKSLGAKFTPELKGPNRNAQLQVEDVFGSQKGYAQAIDRRVQGGRHPAQGRVRAIVQPQRRPLLDRARATIRQAGCVSRRSRRNHHAAARSEGPEHLEAQHAEAGRTGHQDHRAADVGAVDGGERQDRPFSYAKEAKAAGLDIITWTIERSGRIVEDVLPTKGTSSPSFYYQSTLDALENDGDILVTLDALAKIGILGIFSDWSATVTFYANCMASK